MPARTAVKPVLRDRVQDYVKELVFTGRVSEGQPLTELEIANALQVSRTPVREALNRLEREGYLTIVPQRGALVPKLTRHDVEEVFQIREALESYAARIACVRMDPATLDRFEAVFNDAESANPRDDARLVKLGYDLHQAILESSGNHRLVYIVGMYEGHIRRVQRITEEVPGQIWAAHVDHRQLIAILRLRNPDVAGVYMQHHIQMARDATLKAIDARERAAQPK